VRVEFFEFTFFYPILTHFTCYSCHIWSFCVIPDYYRHRFGLASSSI